MMESGTRREEPSGQAPSAGWPSPTPNGQAMRGRLVKAAIPVIVGLGIMVVPAPTGLTVGAWRYFGLFTAVIIALVLEPIPGAAAGFIGVTVAVAFGMVVPDPDGAIKWGLSGFANDTVWLVFGAFIFALGYEKSGLGKRIALLLVRRLGGRTLGLGYAITLADLALAPFTPSNTARSAGTIFPIVRNIPVLYGSLPGETARQIGSYIMWTAFAATCVTSSMFVTALAPNLLALEFAEKTAGVTISMTSWIVGFLPVGVLLVVLLPLLVYVLYPPGIKASREVPVWASGELAKMGAPSRSEIVMAVLVVAAVGFWIFGKDLVDATTVALVAISLMVMTGVVRWDDIAAHKTAWNVWTLLATLVTLAGGLNKVGFITWFAEGAAGLLSGLSPLVVMICLVAVFFVVHYMFASLTAHATAVLPVILAAGLAVPGMPVRTFALLLCYSLGLMGIITPYATGPAPVYFGSGYIPRRDFWLLGLVFGAIFLAVLLGVGTPYLMATNP